MTAKEKFIKIIQTEIFDRPDIWCENYEEDWEDASSFWEEFKTGKIKNSSIITEKGAAVLRFLQTQPSTNYAFTAKMIAEELNMNTRSISGTMRKLLNDGYVEKLTTLTPITYQITPAGLAFDLDKIENK